MVITPILEKKKKKPRESHFAKLIQLVRGNLGLTLRFWIMRPMFVSLHVCLLVTHTNNET